MAYLKVQESLAPTGLWHWVVTCDSGHTWDVSTQSYPSLEKAWRDAKKVGMTSLYNAIQAEKVVDKK